jgi:ribose transport system permease protein
MRKPDTLSVLVFIRSWGIFILLALLWAIFSLWAAPNFFDFDNFTQIFQAASLTAVFAAAIAMGVFSGALDLSVPGIASLSAVIMAWLMTHGVNMWVGIIAAMVTGVALGLINGVISLRGINPLAVTIGMLSITSGVAALITTGPAIYGLEALTPIGLDYYFGVPVTFWIAAGVFIIGTVFLTQTRGGAHFMAAGGNPEALRRAGVNANLFKLLGFILSGLLSAVGGVVYSAYTQQADPTPVTGTLFTGLTAVALSGISLAGGRGSLPKVFVGALVIQSIQNVLILKDIQPYVADAVTGVLLIGALGLELAINKGVSKQVVRSRTAANSTATGVLNLVSDKKKG